MSGNEYKDEIPGITTYLYEKNRDRCQCEFPDWDHANCGKNIKEIENLKTQIGYLETDLLEAELEKSDAWNESNDKQKKIDQLEKDRVQLQITCENLECKTEKQLTLNTQATQFLFTLLETYGNHTLACNIWDTKEIGRILDIAEEEICTCDWTKRKQMLDLVKEDGPLTEEQVNRLLSI